MGKESRSDDSLQPRNPIDPNNVSIQVSSTPAIQWEEMPAPPILIHGSVSVVEADIGGPIVEVERAPAYVGGCDSPADPGARINRARNPNPSRIRYPAPTTVMVGYPTPRLIRDPRPAARTPRPIANAIRSPSHLKRGWAPDPPVSGHILPVTIIVQL